MRPLCRYLLAFAFLAFLAGTAGAQDFSLDQTDLQFTPGAGTSPDPQLITLTNFTGSNLNISLTARTQSGGNWLRASITPNPVPANGQSTITVAVMSANLQPNTYNGTLTVSDGTTKITVNVTLIVSGVTISAPTSKSITLVQGTTGSVTVHVAGGPANLVVTSNANWLMAGGSAEAPGDFSLTVDASLIGLGPHNGGVSLQCASGGAPCLPLLVSVTAVVIPPSSLKANIESVSFQAFEGRMDPQPQSFQITTTDGSSLSLSLTSSSTWLKISSTNGMASSKPVVVTATVTTAQLNPGPNLGTITASASNGSPPVTIPVTATLSPFSISVLPASPLAVSVASGKTQTVALQAGTADGEPASVSVTAQTSDNRVWLKAPATITAPANFNITVDASQLTPGNYSGSLTLTCSDATCPDVKIAINVTVGTGTLAPQVNAVVGAGLSVPPVTSVARDGLFTLFGTGFADPSVSRNVAGSDLMNNALPTNLVNTCVQGGNARWGLIYISATQINAVADPLSTSGTIPLSVIRNCGQPNEIASAPVNVNVAAQSPQFLFVIQNPSGKNEIVAIDTSSGVKVGPTGLIAGQNFAPAHSGDILTAYGVGWGATSPAAVVGSLAPGAANITGDHTLTIGGKTAKVSYAGLTPTYAGLYQINFTVPAGLTAGNQPMVLTIDGVPTPVGAYLAVK